MTDIWVQHEEEAPVIINVVTEIAAGPLIAGLKARLGLTGECCLVVEQRDATRGTREIFTTAENPDESR
jgi:hypothetical protein